MPDPSRLETLMDASTLALKAGDLRRLGALSDETEVALDSDGAMNRHAAERLRDQAQRNATLILAAIQGVKAARQRARDLSTTGQFSTYNAAGQRSQVGVSSLPASRRI